MTNSNASRILALPHAAHPALRRTVGLLAAKPGVTVDEARGILDAACRSLGITGLDLAMIQPGAQVDVPFIPARTGDATGDFQEGVSRHLAAILGSRR